MTSSPRPFDAVLTVALGCFVLLGSGCASWQAGSGGARALQPEVYSGRDGARVAEAVSLSRRARVLYVAERHGDPVSHRAQLQVATMAATVGPVVVAVEWLPASSQPTLDAWIAGKIPDGELPTRLRWRKLWGHPWKAYAPIFHWCRRRRVPMVALNAEPGLARAVGRGGPLTTAQKNQLPALNTGTAAHRARFDEMMRAAAGAHSHHFTPARLAAYYRAQLVWDETMATNVSAILRRVSRDTVVVVCAGGGHLLYRFGLPERVVGAPDALVVRPVSDTPTEPEPSRSGRRRADWLWVVSDAQAR